MTMNRAPRIVTVCVQGATARPRDMAERLRLIGLIAQQ